MQDFTVYGLEIIDIPSLRTILQVYDSTHAYALCGRNVKVADSVVRVICIWLTLLALATNGQCHRCPYSQQCRVLKQVGCTSYV